MKLVEIIGKAQVLSGTCDYDGNATDVNLMAMSLSIFHETLNDINNDPQITLEQKALNYQTYPEDLPQTLFPEISLFPFPIANAYPLPRDCRRVLKAISQTIELRKTDYGEIVKRRMASAGLTSMFAISGNSVQLVRPMPLAIVYAKEFSEFMPQDEVDIPREALSYVINLTAYNIALSHNPQMAERCRVMADKARDALIGNLKVNAGQKYIDPNLSLRRFDDSFGGAWI